MKLLVIYLYFAEPKGSGPATMRILSYIDFHNQLYGHLIFFFFFFFFFKIFFKKNKKHNDKKKKLKKNFFFFFFEKFYGQKRPTRMIPITSDYQFPDIFFMSD